MGNEEEKEQKLIQLDKYKECLMHVNNDLGMLLQNAENLAYKLGIINPENFHYKNYDYYNQYEIKDVNRLRKNIISSLKFLKVQLIAIKQETNREYMFPPSIDNIIYDMKILKKLIEQKSPADTQYYEAILKFLQEKKFIDIEGSEEIYKICYKNKVSDTNPFMWMFMSPPILNYIDRKADNFQNNIDTKVGPDIDRDECSIDKNLVMSNEFYNKIKELNRCLRECKDYNYIKSLIDEFTKKYKKDPASYIEESNKEIYLKIADL